MMDGCDRDFLCQLNIAQKKVLGNTAQETKLALYSLFTKGVGGCFRMYCESNENHALMYYARIFCILCMCCKSNENHAKFQVKSFVFSMKSCHDYS